MSEQRNLYKGSPPRAWIRVRLVEPRGAVAAVELLADTGNPCALIIGARQMQRFRLADGPDVLTNFGLLCGAWLRVTIPEVGFDQFLLGYASDAVAVAARDSDAGFQGLAGLPLLRMMQYGGESSGFWLRQ